MLTRIFYDSTRSFRGTSIFMQDAALPGRTRRSP